MSDTGRAERSGWRAVVRQAMSSDRHPTKVIRDPKVLARYQNSRVLIALLGGLAGSFGLAVSFSGSGAFSVGTAPTEIGVLGVAGMVVAVLLVLFPWWNVVRWLVAGALILAPVLLLDLPLGWQIGLGFIGTIASLIVATIIFWATRAGVHMVELTKAGLAGALLIAVLVGADGADAQGSTCADTTLTIRDIALGEQQTWSGQGDADSMRVDVRDGDARFTIEGESDITAGSVVVELIDTRPLPFVTAGDPVAVWAGDLLPEGDRGRLEPTDVVFRRDADTGLRFVAPDTNVDLRIDAGEGLYRATFTDAISGRTCAIDLRIRILARTLDRPGGEGFVVGLAALFGSVAGVAHGGDPLSRRRSKPEGPDRSAGPKPDGVGSTRTPGSTPPSKPVHASVPPGWTRLEVRLQIDEDEHDPEHLTLEDASFAELASIGTTVSSGGWWSVPITFRRDPRDVPLDDSRLSIGLELDGSAWGRVELSDDTVDVFGPVDRIEIESDAADASSEPANDQLIDLSTHHADSDAAVTGDEHEGVER